MLRRPPHIVVTTPESLYILLGSASGRAMLATTRTVIVDEIHAMAPNKRGAHLALSLERLDALCGGKLQRIGLSATQNPIDDACAVPGRHRAAGGTPPPRSRSSIPATSAARPGDRGARLPAGSGDVGRGLDPGLRPPGAADRGAPDHPGVRQHPPHGGTRRPPTVRPPRRGRPSPRITAAWRRNTGWRRSNGSSAAN